MRQLDLLRNNDTRHIKRDLGAGESLVFGGDEAGRGPVLGPMVLAVVGLTPSAARSLQALGVADSKHFGAGASARTLRGELDRQIRARATVCCVEIVCVARIDASTQTGGLNRLEQEVMRDLLGRASPRPGEEIVCDGERLFAPLRADYPALRALNKAEDQFVAVAAASIVAKHVRDTEFESIRDRYREEFGEVGGGGYPNVATYRFLDAYQARYGELPPEARRSWQRTGATMTREGARELGSR